MEAASRAGGGAGTQLELSTSVEPAAATPPETTPLVSEDLSPVRDVDLATAPAPPANSIHKHRIRFFAILVMPAAIGIAPFMWSMEGAPRRCFLPYGNDTVLNVTCAEVSEPVFKWYTCPAWLVICARMLSEFFNIQFRTLGYRNFHLGLIVLLVTLTYIVSEPLVFKLRNSTFAVPERWQLIRVLGLAICAWPFVAVSIVLIYKHTRLADEHEAAASQASEPEPEPKLEREPALFKVVSEYMLIKKAEADSEEVAPEPEPQIEEVVFESASEMNLKRCWGRIFHHRDVQEVFATSSFRNTGYWSEQRVDIPMTLLENAKDAGHSQAQYERWGKVRHKLVRKASLDIWRKNANLGKKGREAIVRSAMKFWAGIAMIIVNWAWLQLFVLFYLQHATSPAKISIGVLIFNVSEAILGGVVQFLMASAEKDRKWRTDALLSRTPFIQPSLCGGC